MKTEKAVHVFEGLQSKENGCLFLYYLEENRLHAGLCSDRALVQKMHEMPASHPLLVSWEKIYCLGFPAIHFLCLSSDTVIHQASCL